MGGVLAAAVGAPAAWAQVMPRPSDHPFYDLVVVSPRIQPDRVLEPISDAEARLDDASRTAWRDFLASQSARGTWTAEVDRASGLVEIAEGAGLPWIPGAGNDLALTDVAGHLRGRAQVDLDTLESLARSFVAEVGPLVGTKSRTLRLDRDASGQIANYLWNVEFDVYAGELPIDGARVFFRVNNGNLVQWGAERLPGPSARVPAVRIDGSQAFDLLGAYIGGWDDAADWIHEPGRLLLLPAGDDAAGDAFGRGYSLVLAWQFGFTRDGAPGTWRARIDASTGEVLEFRDLNQFAQVTGGYWPVSWRVGLVEQPQVIGGWPFAAITPLGESSNSSGIYLWDTNAQSARHTGLYVNISDNCGGAPGSATSDGSGNIAFGQIVPPNAPGDCVTQLAISDNTPASRQQFFHVNKIMEKGRAYNPSNIWLQTQVTATVNINNTCNAFWNGATLNFYRSGGGCGNTGEDAGISLHEWGHGFDSNDGSPGGTENATGETYGDFTAALQTRNSCTGQGFLLSGANCGGYGNACTGCDGVRDIDWGRHTANVPWRVGTFTQTNCPNTCPGTSCGYVGPCGLVGGATVNPSNEGHCESYVSSGALWDFAAYDLLTGCSTRNAAFPDWNCPGAGGPYNAAGAWGVADRLWYRSRSTANQAFTCITSGTWSSHGCNAGSNWKTMRAADDDDGNLANGTPHSCQLAAAFNRHGIACTTDPAWNVCFTGCTQPAAPTLALDDVANNQVTLSWSPDPSPHVVDVYRNDVGCNAGFTKIADDVPFSSVPFADDDVANGTTYYYQVVREPVGNEACGSAPSNCVSATPAASPSALYVPGSALLLSLPTDTDSDGFVDNCETGRVEFELYNDGNVSLNNLRATISSTDPAVTIATAMPVNLGTLAPNLRATGTFDFDLDGATCNDTVSFDIDVTADQMQAQVPPVVKSDSFSQGELEQDLSPAGNFTHGFETGNDGWTFVTNFARDSSTAAAGTWSVHSSSGVDGACDLARSPNFRPQGAGSQVVMAVRYDIEAPPWDKANVHAVRVSTGAHTLISPTGRVYATGAWNAGLCHVSPENGWAGTNLTWGDATFNLSGLVAGADYYLEVNYNTDSAVAQTGFWFDNVRWTNVVMQVCDGQSNTCTPCVPPNAPTGLVATATAPNQITLTWNAVAPAPTNYRIYRSTSPGGPYTQVGSVGGGTLTFDDTGLTPGETYYYVVRAFTVCESGSSNESSATAFGDCTALPTFGGLSAVDPISSGGTCGLRLAWSPGLNNCGTEPVVYNVYRSTSAGFTPGPGNLLASCVTNAFYDDTAVTGGNTYYYTVQAEDDTTGHGGECQDGNVDGNSSEVSGALSGGVQTLLFENFDTTAAGAIPAGWQTGVFSGNNFWRGARACPGQSAPNVLRYGATTCTGNYGNNSDALTLTPGIVVPAGSTNVELELYHRWNFQTGVDGGLVYLSNAAQFPTFTYVGAAYLSGTGYNSTAKGLAAFSGTSTGFALGTMQNTVVDLSAFCSATAGFTANCAADTIYVAFNGFANNNTVAQGWHVDDVEVRRGGTACSVAPSAVQFLTATATSAQNVIEWLNPAAGGYGTTRVRWSTSGYPADPTAGTLLVDQSNGLGNKGSFTHGGLTNGTTYFYSVFVDNGSGQYSARKTVSARPFATTGPVKMAYSTAASALAPPGIGSVYGVANDRVLHSMDTASGTWPGSWRPLAMNGPAQDRPPIVPVTVGGATKVAFLGSHDGRVYAVNANTGAQIWASPVLGDFVQAAPAGMFTAFGGAYDLLFVGTRNSSSANAMVALNLANGTIAWQFTNGGGATGIGIISGGASVDYATNRLYFASRARSGGSANTVWCLSFNGTSGSLVWGRAIGDVDGSPILHNGKVYVGTNSGNLHALAATTGANAWAAPFATANGTIKGYPWPVFGTNEVLFSSTDKLWSIVDNGASASLEWSVASIANPSTPLAFNVGGLKAWVGSSDGRLYQIDLSGAPAITSVVLGAGTAAVGSPALGLGPATAYVGTEDGRIYSVTLPLP